jgi:hypothetical protein
MPFPRWVTFQLRRHVAVTKVSFGEQLLADAAIVDSSARPNREAVGERMGRSARW